MKQSDSILTLNTSNTTTTDMLEYNDLTPLSSTYLSIADTDSWNEINASTSAPIVQDSSFNLFSSSLPSGLGFTHPHATHDDLFNSPYHPSILQAPLSAQLPNASLSNRDDHSSSNSTRASTPKLNLRTSFTTKFTKNEDPNPYNNNSTSNDAGNESYSNSPHTFVMETLDTMKSQIRVPKKKRKKTSPDQFSILNRAFQINPKPNLQERTALALQLDMTPRAVQVWFQNRRMKYKSIFGMTPEPMHGKTIMPMSILSDASIDVGNTAANSGMHTPTGSFAYLSGTMSNEDASSDGSPKEQALAMSTDFLGNAVSSNQKLQQERIDEYDDAMDDVSVHDADEINQRFVNNAVGLSEEIEQTLSDTKTTQGSSAMTQQRRTSFNKMNGTLSQQQGSLTSDLLLLDATPSMDQLLTPPSSTIITPLSMNSTISMEHQLSNTKTHQMAAFSQLSAAFKNSPAAQQQQMKNNVCAAQQQQMKNNVCTAQQQQMKNNVCTAQQQQASLGTLMQGFNNSLDLIMFQESFDGLMNSQNLGICTARPPSASSGNGITSPQSMANGQLGMNSNMNELLSSPFIFQQNIHAASPQMQSQSLNAPMLSSFLMDLQSPPSAAALHQHRQQLLAMHAVASMGNGGNTNRSHDPSQLMNGNHSTNKMMNMMNGSTQF